MTSDDYTLKFNTDTQKLVVWVDFPTLGPQNHEKCRFYVPMVGGMFRLHVRLRGCIWNDLSALKAGNQTMTSQNALQAGSSGRWLMSGGF